MNELISVVIPAYNSSAYLQFSIGSVAKQKYRPLEIIVIDDGSTDSTTDILTQLRNQLSSDLLFKVVRLERNQGTANALQVGFSKASGRYICWLSADDEYLDTDKLSEQQKIMQMTHAGWSYYTDSYSGKSVETATLVRIAGTPIIRVLERICRTNSELGLLRLLFWNPINGSSVMIDKRCIERYGTFDSILGRVDPDGDLWMRLSALNVKVIAIKGAPVFYRTHSAQTSKRLTEMQTGKELTRLRILLSLSKSGRLNRLLARWKWFFIVLLIENRTLYTVPYTACYVLSKMLKSEGWITKLMKGIILFGIIKSRKKAIKTGVTESEIRMRLEFIMSSTTFKSFLSLLNRLQQD